MIRKKHIQSMDTIEKDKKIVVFLDAPGINYI